LSYGEGDESEGKGEDGFRTVAGEDSKREGGEARKVAGGKIKSRVPVRVDREGDEGRREDERVGIALGQRDGWKVDREDLKIWEGVG